MFTFQKMKVHAMLHNFQQAFKESVLGGKNTLENFLNEGQEARLSIYKNNTFISLHHALLNIFPATEKLVGADFFKFMAYQFIEKNPPSDGCLLFYGEKFSNFLKGKEELQSMPFVADIAQLEWHVHECTHGADEAGFSPLSLNLNAEQMLQQPFKVLENVRFVNSQTKCASLWAFLAENKEGETPSFGVQEPEFYMVFRDEKLDVHVKILTENEFNFLQKFAQKNTLENIFSDENLPEDVLKKWQNMLSFVFERKLLKRVP